MEFLVDLFQKKFNEIDALILDGELELSELKMNLNQIIRLQIDIVT